MSYQKNVGVAIIGAGICGLVIAETFRLSGYSDYVLLDKGKSVGGRMATRRFGLGVFDHGAQFFTARSKQFQTVVEKWSSEKWISPWVITPTGITRYIAIGGMNRLAKNLAFQHPIETNVRIETVSPQADRWLLCGQYADSKEHFEVLANVVIITTPIPQAIQLCIDPQHKKTFLSQECLEILNQVHYDPCIALLLNLKESISLGEQGFMEFTEGPISWIADNSMKNISTVPSITIHASGEWSEKYYQEDDHWIQNELIHHIETWINRDSIIEAQVKKWRYAKSSKLCRKPYVTAGLNHSLVFAGDGFSMYDHEQTGKIETSVLSAIQSASYILEKET